MQLSIFADVEEIQKSFQDIQYLVTTANLLVVEIFGYVYFLVHILGIALAINAVMKGRTTQGSIAWSISLVTFPFVAIPLYLLFGARKFYGYIEARREGDYAISKLGLSIRELLTPYQVTGEESYLLQELKSLANLPALRGNEIQLLKNGEEFYPSLFAELSKAKYSIVIQFYILRHDEVGGQLKDILKEKAEKGLNVYLLYDEIGSYDLSQIYLDDLTQSGVKCSSFRSSLGGRVRRFQVNFRNHRKIVVIDGETAFVGGHNVGREYLGRDSFYGYWRDTHAKFRGPIVKPIQLAFLEDWYWACDEVPHLMWENIEEAGEVNSLCVPSGPSDYLETCGLFFMSLLGQAKKRIWIASPYFVPDQKIIASLSLAVKRGVDVRILLPQKKDAWLIHNAGHSFVEECVQHGVKFYRYLPGIMHQKVSLIDDDMTVIGTANFDNRSFNLNFEISIFSISKDLADQVEEMLLDDFSHCREVQQGEFDSFPFHWRFIYKVASLFSPIL